MAAPSCQLEVLCLEAGPGQRLAVIGASANLGGWDPSRAIPLSNSAQGLWSGAVPCQEANAKFKLIILEQNGAVKEWEPLKNNRKWPEQATGASLRVRMKYGKKRMKVDKTSAAGGWLSSLSTFLGCCLAPEQDVRNEMNLERTIQPAPGAELRKAVAPPAQASPPSGRPAGPPSAVKPPLPGPAQVEAAAQRTGAAAAAAATAVAAAAAAAAPSAATPVPLSAPPIQAVAPKASPVHTSPAVPPQGAARAVSAPKAPAAAVLTSGAALPGQVSEPAPPVPERPPMPPASQPVPPAPPASPPSQAPVSETREIVPPKTETAKVEVVQPEVETAKAEKDAVPGEVLEQATCKAIPELTGDAQPEKEHLEVATATGVVEFEEHVKVAPTRVFELAEDVEYEAVMKKLQMEAEPQKPEKAVEMQVPWCLKPSVGSWLQKAVKPLLPPVELEAKPQATSRPPHTWARLPSVGTWAQPRLLEDAAH